MSKIGVGIIGCGHISSAYLKLAPLFGSLEVRAVADIAPAVDGVIGEQLQRLGKRLARD